MKQKAKRLLSVVLAFLMVIGIMPSGGLMTVPVMAAAEKFEINMSQYNESEMEISDGYSNGEPFGCMWRQGNVKFTGNGTELSITEDSVSGSSYQYAGAEYRTRERYGYGYYEVTMKPIKHSGVVSSFFTYTGPSDGTPWDEIDIEFLGKDTTKVQINYYVNGTGNHERMLDLGFDASEAFHTYGFDWQSDHITWYVDGKDVYTAYGDANGLPVNPGKIMMNVWPGTGVDGWLGAFDGKTPLTAEYKAASYSQTPPGTEGPTVTPTPTAAPTVTPTVTPTPTGGNPSFPSNVTGKVTFFDLYTDKEINPNTSYGFEDWEYYDWRDMYSSWEDWNDESKKTNTNPASKPAGTDRSWTSIGRAFSQNVNPKIFEYWNKWYSENWYEEKPRVNPLYFGDFRPFFRIDNDENRTDEEKSLGIFWTDPWYANNNVYRTPYNSSYTYDRKSYMEGIHGGEGWNFSWFLNRGVDNPWSDEESAKNAGAAVQGIVSDCLDSDGNITERTSGVPLPQFNKAFYDGNSTIGKMYEPMEFPFVVRERNGANYYEFDSGVGNSTYHDTVRMNADGTALTYSNKEEDVVYGIQGGGARTPGFFPFNDPQDSLRDDGSEEHKYDGSGNKLNYGFGMKLEVDFTMDSDGMIKTKSGERIPATFEFSGDDDVWIFVDGKLALDMGGDHGVATGRLNFADRTAVVEQVKGIKDYRDGSGNIVEDANEAVKAEQVFNHIGEGGKDERDAACYNVGVNQKTAKFDIDTTNPKAIHTLTIFYEERGMYESNFRASFNLNLPTKLMTTNQVNVDKVNQGLRQAAKEVAQNDAFTFKVADKDGKSVGEKDYKIQNGEVKLGEDGKMTIKDGQSATFDAQFDRGSELSLVQSGNDRYDTSWTMTGSSKDNSEVQIASSAQESRDSLTVGDSRVEGHENGAFKLENTDTDESVPVTVRVDYKQEPKTNSFIIQKVLDEAAASDEIFGFSVTFSDIFGSISAEEAYDIVYDIYTAEGELVQENALASGGIVYLKAGQYALIKDIPVGTKYKVVENEKVGYTVKNLVSEQGNGDIDIMTDQTTGTITAAVANDGKSADKFIYTNGIKKIDDSFLVEVGKSNTLSVIPKEETDGELTGDLKEISDSWNASEASKKGLVFVVNGQPQLATDGKPFTSIVADGVTYEVEYDSQGTPVLRVTPKDQEVQGKDVITVQYQLVELNDDGTVKYNDNELAKITPVIETTSYFYKANGDIYVLDYGLDVNLANKTEDRSGIFENDQLVNQSLAGTTSTYWSTKAGKNAADSSADKVLESGLIKNGSFDEGDASYEWFIDQNAAANSTVENQEAKYTIKNTGDQEWQVQLKQENINLERNQWYKLTLDAKSDLDRKLKFMIQRNGNQPGKDWTTYTVETVQLTSDYQTFEVKFQMQEPTDSESVFCIAMGAVDGEQISTEHQIFIDNISLEKISPSSNIEAANSAEPADYHAVAGEYGKIIPAEGPEAYTITDQANPKVTYTMSKFLEGGDEYAYGVMVKKADISEKQTSNRFRLQVTSDVTMMPANVVYYEDNFNAGSTDDNSSPAIIYTGTYETEGTSLDLVQSNGQTEQYGHDGAYNTMDNQKDSGGSSTKLTADGYNTKAIFTFTGTGFDILARTTRKTAGIVYTIEKYDQAADKYSFFRMGAVDTYYINGDLYQLPVIHEEGMAHGTYRVTLGIKQTGSYLITKDENGEVIKEDDTRKYVVYLDGIRIYNPLGESGDQRYIADEQGVTVSEIPELIVGNGTVTEKGIIDETGIGIINSQVVEGATAVIASYSSDDCSLEALGNTQTEVATGDSSAGTESLVTYLNAGPNNELYLDEAAALAFVVKATDNTNTLQIEAKLVDIQNSEGSKEGNGLDLRVLSNKNGVVEEKTIDTIKSSTAMYYKIPVEDCISLDNGYYLIVILGNSDVMGSANDTHVLSFSNLKYKNYTIGSPYNTSVYDTSAYLEADEEEPNMFVSVNLAAGLKKNTWQSFDNHSVTLTNNVFGDAEPEFTMYYVNAKGDKVKLTVAARRVKDANSEYQLRFKTPNAKGNFPVEIHYVVDGEESADYIATTMKVVK